MRKRKIKKPPHLRKKNPVRISNPTSLYHTARVYPLQPIKLMLSPPSTWLSAVDENAEFDVELNSEFLIVESVEQVGDDMVCHIAQKYDLSSWAEHSEVYLGDINLKLKNNTHEKAASQKYNVHVCFVQSAKGGRSDVITCVNPFNHFVKVEPGQVLEIVNYDGSWNDWEPGKITASGANDVWEYSRTSMQDPKLKGIDSSFNLLRYEYAGDLLDGDKKEGVFVVKNRYHLNVNPKLALEVSRDLVSNEIAKKKKPVREHHWWFGLTKESLKKVHGLSNESYELCNLEFTGSCKESEHFDGSGHTDTTYTGRNCNVILSVRSKRKYKMHSYFPNENSVEQKMEMRRRLEDRAQGRLVNPLATEHIDLCVGYAELTVEIAQPSVFWEDLDDKERWEFAINDEKLSPKLIKFKDLESHVRSGKVYQRIQISHEYANPRNSETKFLGAIKIICAPKTDCHDGVKRLSCWMTPVSSRVDKKVITSSTVKQYPSYTMPPVVLGGGKPFDYKGRPQVCTVTFEEIKSDTLEDNAYTKKIGEVSVTHDTTCEGKKKFGAGIFDTNDNHISNCSTSGSAVYRLPANGKKSDKENKTKNSESSSKSGKAVCSTGTSRHAALILYGPVHMERIKLEHGQPLLLRVLPPNEKLGDLWTIMSDEVEVESHTTRFIGSNLYQEILIMPNYDRVPLTVGQRHLGAIRLQSSKEKKIVFLTVNVTERTQKEKRMTPAIQSDSDFEMRVVKSQNPPDSQTEKKNYKYLRDWQNYDAIVINPEDTLYLRNPAGGECWNGEQWQLEIQQQSIPAKVFNTLNDLKIDIDPVNPWFKKEPPLILRNTYIFRPFSHNVKDWESVITTLAGNTNDDKFLLAKVVFRNQAHADNKRVVTAFGTIQTHCSLERTVGIYVSLEHKKHLGGFSKVIFNPKDQERIEMCDKDHVVIKMSPEFVSVNNNRTVECPWYLTEWPSWLEYKGMARENSVNLHRFIVRELPKAQYRAVDRVDFVCGQSKRTVWAHHL